MSYESEMNVEEAQLYGIVLIEYLRANLPDECEPIDFLLWVWEVATELYCLHIILKSGLPIRESTLKQMSEDKNIINIVKVKCALGFNNFQF